nr:PREDICTED: protein O-mannose kinase [Latimeria chalumnae]|eukprot:XP_014354369.1 PREDICTED: protein O-mannose kinase [Latimeria chalumnae]
MDKKARPVKGAQKRKGIITALVSLATLLLMNLLLYKYLEDIYQSNKPHEDYHSLCPYGYFRMGAMKNCSPWLTCETVRKEVRKMKMVGEGAVKQVSFSDPSSCKVTDVWKIPEVTDFALGDVEGSDLVRFHLFDIHRDCKKESSAARPSAKTVLKTYREVLASLMKEGVMPITKEML